MYFLSRIGKVVVFCIAASLLAVPAIAQNASVSIGVGDTILEVSGQTSPDAFVTISRDGSIIGTITADSVGAFSQTFAAQEPGLHQLSLYAHTTGGENTDTVTAAVNIAEHTTTAIQFFLPSTLIVNNSNLSHNQPLELSGETTPSSIITIYIDNTNYTTTTSNSQGIWSAHINTNTLLAGQHNVFIRVTDGLGAQSYPTSLHYFSLAGPNPATPLPSQPQPPVPHGGGPSIPRITFPQTDTTWHQPTITIKGSADAYVQIELWDGQHVIASVWSDRYGQWSINLRLEAKEYALRARACLNSVCSNFSPTVHFLYRPDGLVSPLEQPLKITAEQYCFSVYQDELFTIKALIVNGQPPYETSLQWDKYTNEKSTYSQNKLEFTHSYSHTGRYNVTLDVKDSQGRTGQAFFSVQVKQRQSSICWLALLLLLLFILLVILFLLYRRQRHRDRANKNNLAAS